MKNSIIQTPIRFALSLGLLAWSTAACAPQRSADKMAPPIEYKTDRLSSDGLEYEFNPKVDILFVIDHSDSMLEEQTKLKEAADRFVESFGENSLIDYRVGIVSVHDSRRCGTVDPKTQLPIECYPEGRLRPLKGAPSTASPFVVRNEGAQKILKESLAFGTQSLKDGGPRFEELFSPILIATSPEGNQANGGFLRPDSRLVIVMVTDEDDSSASISVEDFLFQLQSNVGLSRVELNAVVATEGCARNNYADAPDKILRAVKMMKGRVFPICNASFGKHLATIGSDIRKKLMRRSLVLPTIPETGTLRLLYGGVEIPKGKGWLFDPRSNEIRIDETIQVKYDPNAKFAVQYTRVEPQAIAKGRAKPKK